jgi:hypothetical protein
VTIRRGPWSDIGLIALAAVLVGCCWLTWGCGERAASGVVHAATGTVAGAVPLPPSPASTSAAEAQLMALRQQRDELASQIDLKDKAIGRVEKERDLLAEQDLRRRLAWLGGIVLIGVLASVGLWFVLPAGLKSWAIYGGLGCLGVAAAAFALRALVPYLEVIGWVLVAGGALFGLWKLGRFKAAAAAAAEHGDRLEAAVRDWFPMDEVKQVLSTVKLVSRDRQHQQGVTKVLAAIRGKPAAPVVTP